MIKNTHERTALPPGSPKWVKNEAKMQKMASEKCPKNAPEGPKNVPKRSKMTHFCPMNVRHSPRRGRKTIKNNDFIKTQKMRYGLLHGKPKMLKNVKKQPKKIRPKCPFVIKKCPERGQKHPKTGPPKRRLKKISHSKSKTHWIFGPVRARKHQKNGENREFFDRFLHFLVYKTHPFPNLR